METFSSLFCQLSSLFTIRSMQCVSVARIPAVVALNVMASPLKSIPLMPFRLRVWNTEEEEEPQTRQTEALLVFGVQTIPSAHVSPGCRCCCAETLRLFACWESRLRHPP